MGWWVGVGDGKSSGPRDLGLGSERGKSGAMRLEVSVELPERV